MKVNLLEQRKHLGNRQRGKQWKDTWNDSLPLVLYQVRVTARNVYMLNQKRFRIETGRAWSFTSITAFQPTKSLCNINNLVIGVPCWTVFVYIHVSAKNTSLLNMFLVFTRHTWTLYTALYFLLSSNYGQNDQYFLWTLYLCFMWGINFVNFRQKWVWLFWGPFDSFFEFVKLNTIKFNSALHS